MTTPDKIKHENEKVRNAVQALKQAQAELKRIVMEEQIACPHSRCALSSYGSNMGQCRICLLCGMVEDGFYGNTLRTIVDDPLYGELRISTEVMYSLRQGLTLRESQRTALTKGECSLEYLILHDGEAPSMKKEREVREKEERDRNDCY